ncbi:4'-phosphopantetheinyl transferase family protein [Bacillus sp. FJAT-26377]|nr:4'-phosphopantetheinyl transferase superfamily protein [Bacillus sp. FJAT-26377]
MRTNQFPKTQIIDLTLKGHAEDYKVNISLSHSDFLEEYLNIVKLLHPQELNYFCQLSFEERIKSYLAGRYTAKKAILASLNKENLEMNEISVNSGVFNQPVVLQPTSSNIQVTITHCENIGAAIAFPESIIMGIDIEKISDGRIAVMESIITPQEKNLMNDLTYSKEIVLTLFWTIKEALSKTLKTGLTLPFYMYEIREVRTIGNAIFTSFENFHQYQTVSFTFDTYICSIAYPKSVSININDVKNLILQVQNLKKIKQVT